MYDFYTLYQKTIALLCTWCILKHLCTVGVHVFDYAAVPIGRIMCVCLSVRLSVPYSLLPGKQKKTRLTANQIRIRICKRFAGWEYVVR